MARTQRFVVMGVSGCGKSLIGARLAESLGLPFFDGDDFHPPENVDKMRRGIPLNDADRQDWLAALNRLLCQHPGAVLACSSLKPQYRERLRAGNDAVFIYLKGDFDTIWRRHCQRQGHYFNGRTMLESQFRELVEPSPEEAVHVPVDQPPEAVLRQVLAAIGAGAG
ncbi:gluconokinase [Marinobacter lutaoensis]|jgi:gluconokinase|uniref:Gluconokinase n=1 Tax=Marinobacter lutaoensis TaxID=135739 RepID=A0A1V2DV56_9GAMM|nr:gluconokinase [Marinobacter lutaoensis]MBI43073.1 gluconate kinase [Oceanospirillales bacterium]NVD34220.1 gluconokinase [Marinobacter lutaoensis]ONF44360.1 gluconate kinase [Marinobacter lutaoensis]|tara:strand:- start:983 stop:1483 length:501 start_codon:yes stop_codon:yes gene_type:complete